jgi:hypothetical protein
MVGNKRALGNQIEKSLHSVRDGVNSIDHGAQFQDRKDLGEDAEGGI